MNLPSVTVPTARLRSCIRPHIWIWSARALSSMAIFQTVTMDPGLCDLVPVLELKAVSPPFGQSLPEPRLSYGRYPHTPAGLPLGSDSHRLWGWILPGLFQPDYRTSPWKKRPCDGQNLHGYVYGGCYGPARCQRRRRGHPLRQ